MKYGTIHRSLPQLGQWVSDESSHSPHASQCFPARFVGRPSESSSIDMSDIAEIISRSSLLPVAAPEWLPGSSRQHVTLQSFRPPLRPPTRRQVRGALKKHRLTCTLFVGLPRFELGTFGPPDHRKVIFEQCLGTKSIPSNSLHGGPAPKDRPCGDLNDPCAAPLYGPLTSLELIRRSRIWSEPGYHRHRLWRGRPWCRRSRW